MLVGITYDLRDDYLSLGYSEEETAEFDSPVTIAAIEASLQQMGHQVDRIGSLHSLVSRLAEGKQWDIVFNIAEGMHGFAREAQIPALLEGYGIPCTFSDALTLSVCLHKARTKQILKASGIATPDFAVVEKASDAELMALQLPLFAKPVAEGTSKGVTGASIIESQDNLTVTCSALLKTFRQPVLVERFLPGREFTVGIVGTGSWAKALGTMEVCLGNNAEQGAYTYENKEEYEDRVHYQLATDLAAQASAEVALSAWRALGCRDAGRVDIRLDEHGSPSVIEVNPLPGLNPERSDLPILCALADITYSELVSLIMDSVLRRTDSAHFLPIEAAINWDE
ncbi:ATP-grasp domain-containing protein [Halodesulfovibrio aestuarii]|uniref:D-alanine--D-alanine ligase family protein n=1 Tax=Halodesulfovibrio aestuarii TaxID=126333 RepID=UPI0004209403